jgi:hypothetical protein
MEAVTTERIAQVHADIADAVARTSEHSTLPDGKQDELLADACGKTCALLRDWVASEDWRRMRPKASARVADAVPARADYARFLDQMLADALARADRSAAGTSLAAALVYEARAAVERTAKRHLTWTQRALYTEADNRMRDLRAEVCRLAGDLSTAVAAGPAANARRKLAWTVLKKAIGVLPALILTLGAVSPPQMEANLSAWTHDAVQVVTTYLIAEQAQPQLLIEPPQLSGPELSLLSAWRKVEPVGRALGRRHHALSPPQLGQCPVLDDVPGDDVILVG